MPTVVTILNGDVTRISVDGSGYRTDTMYARGSERESISVWLDNGTRHQTFGRGGAALVWESSDVEAQARQIAQTYRCRVIAEAEVEAWAARAQVVAARTEAGDAWADAQWDAA